MSRTTATAVQKIIETDPTIIVDVNTDLAPYIETASAIVTSACVTTTLYNETTDTVVLELIERWLAAHCYAVRDPRSASERAGDVATSYESKVDLYLANTRYGQMAMMVDTKGGLAALNRMPQFASKLKVGVAYLGTDRGVIHQGCGG